MAVGIGVLVLIRMESRMIWIAGPPGHRVKHGRSLWRRRVRIAGPVVLVVKRVADGYVLADVRRRVARVARIAVHVGRTPGRRKRVLTVGRSSR